MNLNVTTNEIEKRTLNEVGPCRISDANFKKYQDIVEHFTFDNMFHYWINENNPGPIRRLMLRDILRQNVLCYKNEALRPYRNTSSGTTDNIIHENLYWNLRNHPKLLNEFRSELLFNLRIITASSKPSIYSFEIERFIEISAFLIPLLKPKYAKEVWQHEKKLIDWIDPDIIFDKYIELFNYAKYKFPCSIRAEIWIFITRTLKKEIDEVIKFHESHPGNLFIIKTEPKLLAIATIFNHLSDLIYMKSVDNPYSAFHYELSLYIEFLETNLPETIYYFSVMNMRNALTALYGIVNPRIFYSCTLRHLRITETEEYYNPLYGDRNSLDFLFWLRGHLEFDKKHLTDFPEYDELSTLIDKFTNEISHKFLAERPALSPFEIIES